MKRHLVILMALSIIFGTVMTGCGQREESSEPLTTFSTSSDFSTVEVDTESAVEQAEKSAEEKVEVPEVSYPLTEEPVELSMWIDEPNLGPLRMWGGDYGVDIYEDYASIQCVNELTNVHVSFENASSENSSTLFNLHVASGDWADMIAQADIYYVGGVAQAYSDGVLMELGAYLESCSPNYNAIQRADPEISRASTDDDGNVLQVCSILDNFYQTAGTVIRKDWLEKTNMEVPATIDELYTVLKAFQTEIGCTNPFYFDAGCNQLLSSYNLVGYESPQNSNLAVFQIEGTICSSFTEDAYRDWLSNMHQWYVEKLIDPDFISVAGYGGHDEELLAADDLGVWWANVNSITNFFAECPAEDFDIVPAFITATEDSANHVTSTSRLVESNSNQIYGVGISATCQYPELALGWLDYWYCEDGIMLENYGIEGESYDVVNGKIQYTEVVTDNEFNLVPVVALKLSSFGGRSTSFGVQRDEHTFPLYIDQQVEAVECWTAPCDGAWALPRLSLTTEETDTIARTTPDITTYIAEQVPKFIMGETDLSEWDTFVETVNNMGMLDCLEIYQEALDRYNT